MTKRGSWVLSIVSAGLMAFVTPVQASLVTNGGFETGDFAGWSQTGDTTFNGVQCPGPDPSVYEGNCSAFFGPSFSVGGIEQTIGTEFRHFRIARFGVGGVADPMGDRIADRVEIAAPEPIVIQQVRIAERLHPRRTRTMALRAIGAEHCRAGIVCIGGQLRI